jgi:signal transduction histidine kinase
MKSAISQGKPCKVVLRNYRKDGALFWNELTITPIYNDNADLTHFIGVQNDVTIRKKEELLKDHIRKILEMITKHKALKEIGNLIIKTAEENLKNSVVAISLFDEKNESLYHLSGSSLPKKFIKAIDGIAIQYISCNCATAIKTKEEIISEDITRDSNWMEFNKKVKHDFYACWSFPILSSEKTVLGTFSVYYKYPKTPEESERLIISDVVRLASVAIEQHNTNEILQKSREQLEKYTLKLEEEVRFRTMELMTTVKKLVKSNLNFESQIEETKQAEHRALSNQTMFLAIAKNFPKGAIAVVNNDFKIEYIEGRELDNFQVKTEDLMGLSIDNINILNLKQKEAIKKDIVKTLSGDHLTFEVDFKKNTYVINTTPLTSNGDGIQQALFVYSNITEQKQIELDILEALRKEQELNELKSRFISLASHEFRTPLSAILSSANLIGKQPNDQEERRKKYVSIIKSNVKSLATILNDFLSLSKLEEGKVLSEPSKFELIEFCKSIIEEIEPSKKEGQVIAMQHDSKEIEVYFDPKIIRHAVTNLMSNAIKYSKQYDKINITIKKNEKNIVLEVSDQGIGIPSEEQGNLFNRFFRARNAININGIGLGLFIVKQYIELISGTITFESELNKGTTFFVELPINQKNDEKSLTY